MTPRTCPRCLEQLRECICEPDDDSPEPWREIPFRSPDDAP